jgi:hypothetical protein
MYAENETLRASTLADSIQQGHKLADLIEAGLAAAQGVLTGMGSSKDGSNAAPSCGLAGDARSLVGRLERILQAVSAVNNELSAPPSLSDYQDANARAFGVQAGRAQNINGY